MTNSVNLEFFDSESGPQLVKSTFYNHSQKRECVSIRGKTSGAYRRCGTFQWTTAVRAIAIMFLKAKLHEMAISVDPRLIGVQDSLASSLDYALSKETNWIGEMFGYESNARATARRLFKVTNPNRKRPGPVVIAINDNLLTAKNITILSNSLEITRSELLSEMIDSISGTVC